MRYLLLFSVFFVHATYGADYDIEWSADELKNTPIETLEEKNKNLYKNQRKPQSKSWLMKMPDIYDLNQDIFKKIAQMVQWKGNRGGVELTLDFGRSYHHRDDKGRNIPDAFLLYASALTKLTIKGEGIKSLPSNMVNNCDKLTNIELSGGIKNIGEDFAKDCKALTHVTMPCIENIGQNFLTLKKESVSSYGSLYGKKPSDPPSYVNLIISFPYETKSFFSVTKNIEEKYKDWANNTHAVIQKIHGRSVNLVLKGFEVMAKNFREKPLWLTEIGDDWLKDTVVGSVVLPTSITKVGNNFCANTKNLSQISCSLKTIGDNFCAKADLLETLLFLQPFKAGNNFCESSGLQLIDLKKEAVLGSKAFYDCSSLREIKTNKINAENNFCKGSGLRSVELGEVTLGDDAFSRCHNLKNITINKIGKVGRMFADRCEHLESIMLKQGADELGENFGYMCKNLQTFDVGGPVKKIGRWFGFQCGKLKSFILPEGSEEIGSNFLNYCKLDSLTLPSTLTRVGDGFLEDSKVLELYRNDRFVDFKNEDISFRANWPKIKDIDPIDPIDPSDDHDDLEPQVFGGFFAWGSNVHQVS